MDKPDKTRRTSLRVIYLVVLSVVFTATFCAFIVFDYYSQKDESVNALLEEARTFAHEMDAVWSFMDNAQTRINTSADGDYDFKGLHCAIVGKSVGAIFSMGSDYAIRYTNFNPRNVQGTPDSFETRALEAFCADASTTEYYGIADYKGNETFRYLRVLEVDAGCLECHGSPVGELDITGHAKEGWTLDSIGGAISVVIPLDQQNQSIQSSLVRDAAFYLIIIMLAGVVIYAVTRVCVLRPIEKIKRAFNKMKDGERSISIVDKNAPSEMDSLFKHFNEMARELQHVYDHLEDQVESRTLDLREATIELEYQRDNLEILNKQLAKEARFRSNLLSMVNHELRTPLTSISTLAQISKEACAPAQAEERDAWEDVQKNSQVLLEMINNMLDIARSDAGVMTAASDVVDLGDVALAVRGTIEPLAKKYQVTFSVNVAPEVSLVKGDAEKIQRMLENLVSNAVKFTPDGGRIALDMGMEPESGDIVLHVTDDGIGIAEEDQARIFERFVQVDSTSTRKYNGSGLGLAIVQEYADLQGFRVSVRSELGEGSTFTVRIPSQLVLSDSALLSLDD